MRSLFPLICIVWIVVTLCAPVRAEKGPIQLHSVKADFMQEKHVKILAKPLISKGTFTFQSPRSLRWQYSSPVQSLLLMHDDKVRKFVERDGELQEEKGGRFDFMQVVMSDIGHWLEGRFTENELFKVSFPTERLVHLQPKSESMARLISRIELTLGDKRGTLDTVRIVENQDSYTAITFSNRVLNQKIPALIFTQQ